jgi:hypothetical protein
MLVLTKFQIMMISPHLAERGAAWLWGFFLKTKQLEAVPTCDFRKQEREIRQGTPAQAAALYDSSKPVTGEGFPLSTAHYLYVRQQIPHQGYQCQ